jgi:TPP-dependent pyruvate/acetoin dehydrogenase alpha subunit
MLTPDFEATLTAVYRTMYLIRRVEQEIVRLYPTDKIKSPVHLSIGQEAVAAAVCAHLTVRDVVFATYRGHAAYLAKGGDLNGMMAELYGKAGGCARGKGGSMHLVDASVGMVGTSAIVASAIPQAVGYAFAQKVRQRPGIVVNFFGEGATDEGAFHESMNFAALKALPILFVCENNSYAIYSRVEDRLAGPGLCARAEAYGIPARRIEGGGVLDLLDAAAEAIGAIRAGSGPRFLECETYRWHDHVGPGDDRQYRTGCEAELDRWTAADQVAALAERLDRTIGEAARRAVEQAVETALAAAIDFAEDSPYPPEQEIFDHVFAQ